MRDSAQAAAASSAPRATARPRTASPESVTSSCSAVRPKGSCPATRRRSAARLFAGCGWCIIPVDGDERRAEGARAARPASGSQAAGLPRSEAGRLGGAVAEQVGVAVVGDRSITGVALRRTRSIAELAARVSGMGGGDLVLERVPLGGDRRGERRGRQESGCPPGVRSGRPSRVDGKAAGLGTAPRRSSRSGGARPSSCRSGAPETGRGRRQRGEIVDDDVGAGSRGGASRGW